MENVNLDPSSSQSGSVLDVFGQQDVNKDQFLQLLVTQLQHQDPFEPMKNEEFLAQLATFSQLEEQQQTTRLLSDMVSLQQIGLTLGGLSQGAALVGKTVTYVDPESGQQISGVVQSIHFDQSGVMVEVNGNVVPIGSIATVSNGETIAPETGGEETTNESEEQETSASGPDA